MTLIYAYRGHGITHDIVIQDVDDNTITPLAGDEVRAIIGHDALAAPVLTVSSLAPTANGSSFTKGSSNRLRLAAADLDFAAGVYDLQVTFVDSSDANEEKVVSRQVFSLEEDIT